MKNLIVAMLLLLSGAVQAITVDATIGQRYLYAAAYTHGGVINDMGSYNVADPEWNDGVVAVQCDNYGPCIGSHASMTSNVPISGIYDDYTMGFSLDAIASDGSYVDAYVSANFESTLVFSERVYYSYTLSCSGGQTIDIIGSCEEGAGSGFLNAGSYDFLASISGDTSAGGAISGGTGTGGALDYSITFSAVPIPAAVWLFGSALAGLGFVRGRKG